MSSACGTLIATRPRVASWVRSEMSLTPSWWTSWNAVSRSATVCARAAYIVGTNVPSFAMGEKRLFPRPEALKSAGQWLLT